MSDKSKLALVAALATVSIGSPAFAFDLGGGVFPPWVGPPDTAQSSYEPAFQNNAIASRRSGHLFAVAPNAGRLPARSIRRPR